MIRRKDKKVIIPQFLQEDTQILVEPFDLFSVTHRIPAVSPQSVKIYQVCKAETMKVLLADINGLLHTMNGVGGAVDSVIPMPQKMSLILPTLITSSPSSFIASRTVCPVGGIA